MLNYPPGEKTTPNRVGELFCAGTLSIAMELIHTDIRKDCLNFWVLHSGTLKVYGM
jgi:hypothetical protein